MAGPNSPRHRPAHKSEKIKALHDPTADFMQTASEAQLQEWMGQVAPYLSRVDKQTLNAMRQCVRIEHFAVVTPEQLKKSRRFWHKAKRNNNTESDNIKLFNLYKKLRRMPENKQALEDRILFNRSTTPHVKKRRGPSNT